MKSWTKRRKLLEDFLMNSPVEECRKILDNVQRVKILQLDAFLSDKLTVLMKPENRRFIMNSFHIHVEDVCDDKYCHGSWIRLMVKGHTIYLSRIFQSAWKFTINVYANNWMSPPKAQFSFYAGSDASWIPSGLNEKDPVLIALTPFLNDFCPFTIEVASKGAPKLVLKKDHERSPMTQLIKYFKRQYKLHSYCFVNDMKFSLLAVYWAMCRLRNGAFSKDVIKIIWDELVNTCCQEIYSQNFFQ
jgi:hypothetical protein